MAEDSILYPVYFSNYRPKVDKTAAISLHTQELTTDDICRLHDMQGVFGFMFFKKESPITEAEAKELEKVQMELTGKTNPQRFRNVLHVLWSQGEKDITFEEFYAREWAKILNHYKSKLER